MGRKMKAKLIALLLAILSLFVLAGCSMGESLDEVLDTRDLSPHVTYYANGGLFESNNAVKDLYYSTGSKALNIGTVNPISGSVDIKRDGFEIVGETLSREGKIYRTICAEYTGESYTMTLSELYGGKYLSCSGLYGEFIERQIRVHQNAACGMRSAGKDASETEKIIEALEQCLQGEEK